MSALRWKSWAQAKVVLCTRDRCDLTRMLYCTLNYLIIAYVK
jgi:hypothetical protein